MGRAFSRLTEIQHGDGRYWRRFAVRLASSARSTCTTDVPAHRVLLFASDQLSLGQGLTRAMGSRFAPGAFLVSEPKESGLNAS